MKTMRVLPMERNDMVEVMQIIGWAKRSQFEKSGEKVALGIVTNVKKIFAWLCYSYLFIRGRMNPLAFGIG